jgi:hypothetical protein
MPIVPFLCHGHVRPPRTSVLGKDIPKDGLRLRLTCNQHIGSIMSTKGTPHDLSTYGYIFTRLSRSVHLVK